jgi:hypothetical protein
MGHVVVWRCPAGLTMVAHSAGRVREAWRPARDVPRDRERARREIPEEDFLSGGSGTVGGLGGGLRRFADRLDDAFDFASARGLRLRRAARSFPERRRVLVLGVELPERAALVSAARAELERSRHDVEVHFGPAEGGGKFENLNRLLDRHAVADRDWLIVVDDDMELPRGFLDNALFLAERFSLDLAQPAHRRHSHAAWQVTRRRVRSAVRETAFVEIGPVTAFARSTFELLLPFPPLRMGWGLDAHWAALAREQGWRCGVLDAVPVRHSAAPAVRSYSRAEAMAEARAFLAEHPYLPAAELQRTLATHRGW